MSYSVKRGKVAKYPKLGEVVQMSIGRDQHGQYWWAQARLHGPTQIADNVRRGGPFRTKAEAEKDFQVTVLGPQCKIAHGGMWDPAWDRVQ
jgi:hypothetical protein